MSEKKLPPRCRRSSSSGSSGVPSLVSGTLKTSELPRPPTEAPLLTSRAATMTLVHAFHTSDQSTKRLAKSTQQSSSSSGPSSGPPSFRNKLPPKCPKFVKINQPKKSISESCSSSSRSPQSQTPSLKSSSPSSSPKKPPKAGTQCDRGLPRKKKFFQFRETTPAVASPTSATSLPTPPYTTRAQISRYINIVPIRAATICFYIALF